MKNVILSFLIIGSNLASADTINLKTGASYSMGATTVTCNLNVKSNLLPCVLFPGYGTILIGCTRVYERTFSGTPKLISVANSYVQSGVCSSVQISQIDINFYNCNGS